MAMMVRAYTGIMERDGRFVADSPTTKLPVGVRVIVNILEGEASVTTNSQRQREALSRLYAGLASIDDEPFDGDLPRFDIGRELDL